MEILDVFIELVCALFDHGGEPERVGWRAWAGSLGVIGIFLWWPEIRAHAGDLLIVGMIALAAGALLMLVRRVERPRGGGVVGLRLIPRRESAR